MASWMSFQLPVHFHKTLKNIGGFSIPSTPDIFVTILSSVNSLGYYKNMNTCINDIEKIFIIRVGQSCLKNRYLYKTFL